MVFLGSVVGIEYSIELAFFVPFAVNGGSQMFGIVVES